MFYEFFLNVFVTFNAIDVLFDIGINYIVNHYHMGVGFIDYVINNFFVGEVPIVFDGNHVGEISAGGLKDPFNRAFMNSYRQEVFRNVPPTQVTITTAEAIEAHLREMCNSMSAEEAKKDYDGRMRVVARIIKKEFGNMVNTHRVFDELAAQNGPLIIPIVDRINFPVHIVLPVVVSV